MLTNPADLPRETNSLQDRGFRNVGEWQDHLRKMDPVPVDWTDPDLRRITVLRLLSDPGFPAWDVSYCHGEMKDGRIVEVRLPFDQLQRSTRGRRAPSIARQIVGHAIRDGVNAKRLGILDNLSTLV